MSDDQIYVDPGTGAGKLPVEMEKRDDTGRYRQVVRIGAPNTATRSNVPAAAADTLLLAANAARLAASIVNDSSARLYIGYGASAVSASDYTAIVPAGTRHIVDGGFAGEIRGIWTEAVGAAQITELT